MEAAATRGTGGIAAGVARVSAPPLVGIGLSGFFRVEVAAQFAVSPLHSLLYLVAGSVALFFGFANVAGWLRGCVAYGLASLFLALAFAGALGATAGMREGAGLAAAAHALLGVLFLAGAVAEARRALGSRPRALPGADASR